MTRLTPFTIHFKITDTRAKAIRVPVGIQAEQALRLLHLQSLNGSIVMHGGAGNMSPDLHDTTTRLLRESVVPFAQEHGLLVAFGGTRSGAMKALSDAYCDFGATFPLLGICPIEPVLYPGHPADRYTLFKPLFKHRPGFKVYERYPLDPYYTHFILMENGGFGIESELMVQMTRAFGKPGASILINGGQISRNEIIMQLSRENPVATIKGSGRAADEILDPTTHFAQSLPAGSQVEAIDLHKPKALVKWLEKVFEVKKGKGKKDGELASHKPAKPR